jgi:hypothetical protein
VSCMVEGRESGSRKKEQAKGRRKVGGKEKGGTGRRESEAWERARKRLKSMEKERSAQVEGGRETNEISGRTCRVHLRLLVLLFSHLCNSLRLFLLLRDLIRRLKVVRESVFVVLVSGIGEVREVEVRRVGVRGRGVGRVVLLQLVLLLLLFPSRQHRIKSQRRIHQCRRARSSRGGDGRFAVKILRLPAVELHLQRWRWRMRQKQRLGSNAGAGLARPLARSPSFARLTKAIQVWSSAECGSGESARKSGREGASERRRGNNTAKLPRPRAALFSEVGRC